MYHIFVYTVVQWETFPVCHFKIILPLKEEKSRFLQLRKRIQPHEIK